MSKILVNIACGNSYAEGWHNFDYAPHSSAVKKVNLLGYLPFSDGVVDVLYSSHFFEHIPNAKLNFFLSECFRILKSGSTIRLVLPDLEEICREYIFQKDINNEEKAYFLSLELIDQCVRLKPGGTLEKYYTEIAVNADKYDLQEYIQRRTGVELFMYQKNKKLNTLFVIKQLIRNPKKAFQLMESIYCRLVISFLPSAFKQQNISYTHVGEKHAWVYDFYEVSRLLQLAGFKDIKKMTFDSSGIDEFPFEILDMNSQGLPRKGAESMYIEAIKI